MGLDTTASLHAHYCADSGINMPAQYVDIGGFTFLQWRVVNLVLESMA